MRALIFVLFFTVVPVQAATVYKCKGSDGGTIFSHFACPDASAGAEVKVTSASEGMRIASPAEIAEHELEKARENEPSRLSVSGGRSVSACSDASEQEIRTAIVKNQVFPGMSADQAIKAWGKPSKINTGSSGDDQWVYYRGPVESQYLYVSQDGCVTAWN